VINMSKRRFAPLINLLYATVAIGEGMGRYAIGDLKGSEESSLAAAYNVIVGIFPYMKEDDKINVSSAIFNAVYATLSFSRYPAGSFTFKFFPLIAVYQGLTNVIEIYKNKKIK
jgi:hypothetical protein